MIDYEKQLIKMIQDDTYMIRILKTVERLKCEDAWVCAGFIRNKVWDVLHDMTTSLNDIDVIYFDSDDISRKKEKELEKQLEMLLPNQPWSVKNQARMHLVNAFKPFTSSFDGVAHFPETLTAIAVRMCDDTIEIMAPYGIKDLFELKIKPTPLYQKNGSLHAIYLERIKKKNWHKKWPNLSIKY